MKYISVLLFCSMATAAHAGFLNKRAEGWHWYEDRAKKEGRNNEVGSSGNASQNINNFRVELEKRLHQAIDNPTEYHITSYLELQQQLMNKSQAFADAWQRVVYTNPKLDHSTEFPVNQSARHIYLDQQKQQRRERIKKLSQEYGLLFLFKGDCPYCHGFAPVVKRFAKTYGWEVLPVSIDGGAVPEFPSPQRDNGTTARLGVDVLPALIAIHPDSGKAIPLAYGMISEAEIVERVMVLTGGEK